MSYGRCKCLTVVNLKKMNFDRCKQCVNTSVRNLCNKCKKKYQNEQKKLWRSQKKCIQNTDVAEITDVADSGTIRAPKSDTVHWSGFDELVHDVTVHSFAIECVSHENTVLVSNPFEINNSCANVSQIDHNFEVVQPID